MSTSTWHLVHLAALFFWAGLVWVKIACAAIAIGANLACAGAVRLRHRNAATPVGAKYDHWVKRAWVGVPFGLAALYIGLTHFHEWS
jgi:hypothetical protein